MKYVRLVAMTMLACGLAGGCGDDSDGDGGGRSDQDSGSASPDVDGGPGMDAGGGTGGSGGSGGTGGSPAPAPVECGDTTCEAPADPLGAGLMAACCYDAPSSTCGVSAMGMPCGIPPEPDPRCPSADVAGFITLASCCTPEGDCGIDATLFGSGCIELGEAETEAMTRAMGIPIEFPDPRRCDAPGGDGGTEEDAGSE